MIFWKYFKIFQSQEKVWKHFQLLNWSQIQLDLACSRKRVTNRNIAKYFSKIVTKNLKKEAA